MVFLFVMAPGIFKALPRQAAGDAMNAIFPRFYGLAYGCGFLALATLALLPERTTLRLGLVAGMLALLFLAGQVMGSQATELRLELRRVEAAAGEAAAADSEELRSLKARFGKLHGMIMVVDLTVLVLGFILLWLSFASLTPAAAVPAPVLSGAGARSP